MFGTSWNYIVDANGNATIGNGTTTQGNAIISLGVSAPLGGLSITIPSEINGHPVTAIGQYAFMGIQMTSISIPSTVTSIGQFAFHKCVKLASVNIPNSVTTIGSGAFTMTGLASITIPSRFFHLTVSNSYEGSDYFSNVTLAYNKSWYNFYTWLIDRTMLLQNSPLAGGIFATLRNNFQAYYGYNTQDRVLQLDGTFGDTFASIAYQLPLVQQALNASAKLWAGSVLLPTNPQSFRVTQGSYLSTLNQYQTITFADYCVFTTTNSNGALSQQEVTNQLNGYRTGVRRCGSLQLSSSNLTVSFHSSVRSFGQVSFGNTFIGFIVIPGHIGNLDHPLFANCPHLQEITVLSPEMNYWTEAGTLFKTSISGNQTTLIQYPVGRVATSYKIPIAVTTIGTNAFANCTNLNFIHFPNGLLIIGDGAFSGCTNFKGYTSSNQNVHLMSATTIGQNAFNGCSSLTHVTIDDLVTSIGDSAFQNCSGLTYMRISRSITQINAGTFSGCANLKSIIIPSLVTSIGASAFRYCSSLNDLRIEDWVTSIGTYAFDGCSELSTLVLPPAVVNLGTRAFTNCAPSNFSVTMSNNWFNTAPNSANVGGVSNWTMFKAAFDANINAVCVLTGYYVFSPLNGGSVLTARDVYVTISSLKLSSNYTSVKYSAYISKDVKIIDDGAFQICTNLKTMHMSTNVETISARAFQGCSSLHTFIINNFTHSKLNTVGDGAFTGTDLNIIIIPDSVTHIGKWAFYKCLIKEVIFYPGTNIDIIDDYCFASCTNLKILRIPNMIKSIGKYAFSNCVHLTEIILPSTLETIGESAFESCVSLGGLNVPDSVTYIGENAFQGLSSDFGALAISTRFGQRVVSQQNASALSVPKEILSIRDINIVLHNAHLFYKCTYDYQSWVVSVAYNIRNSGAGNHRLLTDSAIWNSYIGNTPQYHSPLYDSSGNYLKSFGQRLHVGGGILTKQPTGLFNLGLGTFYCQDWADYIINNIPQTLNNSKVQSEDAWLNLQNTTATYSGIPPQTTIFKYTFDGSAGALTREMVSDLLNGYTGNFGGVIINTSEPSIPTKIAENAFEQTNVVSIHFPKMITEIAGYAFRGTRLSGVLSIPNTVTTIGAGAFQDCSGITQIVIPNSVVTIGENAFRGCGISYIIIPSSVTTIGAGAFQNCAQLTNVYAPIPPSTPPNFYTNYNTSSAYFNTGTASPNIKYNYTLDFYPGNGTNRITHAAVTNIIGGFTGDFVANINGISNSAAVYIENDAFSGTKITNVIIGNFVEGIGDYAFNNCTRLTNVSIGSGIQTIGTGAFLNCQTLRTVKLPSKMYNKANSTYFLSGNAIQYAYYCVISTSNSDGILTSYDVDTQIDVGTDFSSTISITFDSSVDIIGANAFNGARYVDNIIIPPNIISIGSHAFANCANMESLVCVGGSEALLYSIGEYACYNCRRLSMVVLPLSLLNIGTMAFIACSSLYSVVLPSIFDYSYMVNTTAYFVTTNQKDAGWNSDTPYEATGTFFTFHFETTPGHFYSYSYEKDFYINQKIQEYDKEQAEKAAKKSFWTKLGWDLLVVTVLVVVTVATDGLGDAAVIGLMGPLIEGVGSAAARKALTTGVAVGIDLAVDQYVPLDKSFDGTDPFTSSEESAEITHQDGSWIVTSTFTTNQRINVDDMRDHIYANVTEVLHELFGDRFINDPPIVECNQIGLKQYSIILTLDIDYDTITDEDKTAIENTLHAPLTSFLNPDYIALANEAPTANVSVANICFPANTPINTDQGIISIKRIDPSFHTINKNRIVAITQTITLAKYLICFKRDSLGKNYPAEDTIMSKEHKVYYMGRMIEAKHFVGQVKNVFKIPYHGEILYNVLMERYNKLQVNNLICETLHPENVVAQLCVGNFKESDKGDIIKTLNNCIYKNSPKEYEALVKYIFKQAIGEKPFERLKQLSFGK